MHPAAAVVEFRVALGNKHGLPVGCVRAITVLRDKVGNIGRRCGTVEVDQVHPGRQLSGDFAIRLQGHDAGEIAAAACTSQQGDPVARFREGLREIPGDTLRAAVKAHGELGVDMKCYVHDLCRNDTRVNFLDGQSSLLCILITRNASTFGALSRSAPLARPGKPGDVEY